MTDIKPTILNDAEFAKAEADLNATRAARMLADQDARNASVAPVRDVLNDTAYRAVLDGLKAVRSNYEAGTDIRTHIDALVMIMPFLCDAAGVAFNQNAEAPIVESTPKA